MCRVAAQQSPPGHPDPGAKHHCQVQQPARQCRQPLGQQAQEVALIEQLGPPGAVFDEFHGADAVQESQTLLAIGGGELDGIRAQLTGALGGDQERLPAQAVEGRRSERRRCRRSGPGV